MIDTCNTCQEHVWKIKQFWLVIVQYLRLSCEIGATHCTELIDAFSSYLVKNISQSIGKILLWANVYDQMIKAEQIKAAPQQRNYTHSPQRNLTFCEIMIILNDKISGVFSYFVLLG